MREICRRCNIFDYRHPFSRIDTRNAYLRDKTFTRSTYALFDVVGHMIFKRSFLPNVLATQISIASVIPFIFAAIYFLTKKAFILSKIALIVTSVVSVLYRRNAEYYFIWFSIEKTRGISCRRSIQRVPRT